ncbi:kinase-like domain-containing protein [Xylaria sp. FL0933]|nr:kinase-like domain-containing protein [Xylaria sp. FL0933]
MSHGGGGTNAEDIREFVRDIDARRRSRNLLSPEIYHPGPEVREDAPSQHESDVDSRVADYGFQAWARNSKKSKPLHDTQAFIGLEDVGKEAAISPQTDLAMDLELAMLPALPNDAQTYLPLGQVEAICRRDTVRRELMRTFGENSTDLDRYTDYVCGSQDGSSQDENTSRKIFANLVLIGQLRKINDFVEAGIKDKHLPFRKAAREPIGETFTLVKRATLSRKTSEPVFCFDNWNPVEKRKFYDNQWRLLSPYFDRAPDGSVGLYELDEQSIMPWIGIGEERRGTFVPSENHGGYAKVTQVAIHPDHHAFEAKKFAIKELFEDDDIPFTNEFRNLKRVQTREHLLPVYAAYRRGPHYSFIFPWADGGSLNDLWATEPLSLKQKAFVNTHEVTDAHRTRKVITWVARQLAGLTGKFGLGFLHDTQFLEPPQPSLAVPESERRYGIHGDIKPHNILYFEQDNNEDGSSLGLFKISDFGLTGFHSALTRSRQPPTGPHSPTYRAPEYGMSTAYLSRKYDIWGLGCVLLQFLTWLISGPQCLRQFDQDRLEEMDENNLNFKEDKFFKFVQNEEPGHKSSVQSQIKKLQDELTRGNYLFDCLELIKTRMLVLDSTERADCKEVHDSLARCYKRCLEEPEYAADILPVFKEQILRPYPQTPDIRVTTYSSRARPEASNGINTGSASNVSEVPTESRVSTSNTHRTEETQFRTSNGSSSDEESDISAILTASRTSTGNNAPPSKHEEVSNQADTAVPQQDGLDSRPRNTITERKYKESKAKKVMDYLRLRRLVSWFRRSRSISQTTN